MTVGPMGLVARRLFSAAAMGLGLCLWGLEKQKEAAVYQQVNSWRRPPEQGKRGWRQLGRWVLGIVQGRLFRGLLPGSLAQAPRAVAERAAAALAARCSPTLCTAKMSQQVFWGAALAL